MMRPLIRLGAQGQTRRHLYWAVQLNIPTLAFGGGVRLDEVACGDHTHLRFSFGIDVLLAGFYIVLIDGRHTTTQETEAGAFTPDPVGASA